MYSSAETVPSGELPTYGQLNGIHSALIKKRNAATDPLERSRLTDLIANVDGLKKNPGDVGLMKQFSKNTAGLEKYLAERDNG
jgi:hypothetical protein